MDYKAAANFLALGARTVQFCTVVMKYGFGVVDELHSGLSYLMAERGLASVGELIGRALPDPITGFMDLSATKKISARAPRSCASTAATAPAARTWPSRSTPTGSRSPTRPAASAARSASRSASPGRCT